MLLTSPQAMMQYHAAYNNELYQTVCGGLVWIVLAGQPTRPMPDAFELPEYLELANLLTDSALEICGVTSCAGSGWKLAYRLHQLTTKRLEKNMLDVAAMRRVFELVEAYLQHYRQHMQQFSETLRAGDSQTRTEHELETSLHLAQEAIRIASEIPNWQGRTAYHLTAAGTGYLRTALILLQSPEMNEVTTGSYLYEKVQRAVRDSRYALDELIHHAQVPVLLTQLQSALHQLFEER